MSAAVVMRARYFHELGQEAQAWFTLLAPFFYDDA